MPLNDHTKFFIQKAYITWKCNQKISAGFSINLNYCQVLIWLEFLFLLWLLGITNSAHDIFKPCACIFQQVYTLVIKPVFTATIIYLAIRES